MTFNPDNTNEHVQQDDPFDSATNATLAPRAYYGQIDIDAWYCALVKGQGKVPYDAAVHERKSTAITILVTPLAEQKVTFTLKREMIAESREWAGIVWPSVKALGITSARDLNDKWAKVIQAPTGRKYRSKDGEEREASTFKFLAIYPDETACRAAFYAETPATPDDAADQVGPIPGFDDGTTAPAQDKERETATKFLEVMIKQHSGNKAAIWAQVQGIPMITKYYQEADLDAVIATVYQPQGA